MKNSTKKSAKKIQKKLIPTKKTKSTNNPQSRLKTKKTIAKSKIKSKMKSKVKIKVKPKIKIKIKTKTKTKQKLQPKQKIKIKTKAKIKPKTKVKRAPTKPTKKTTSKKSSATTAVLGPIDVQPYYFKKNENYMNKKQLAHFQAILLKWKEELMADVDNTMHHMKDGVSNYPDPVDRASQEEEFSLELRTRDRERKLLKKIDETLMRINDEDYGYCDDCGAEIGIRRLEARPTATQCIECKTIAEIREKQIGESNQ